MVLPEGSTGLVVFAHGSGSSRHSPRNRLVADTLNRAGIGTLLFDLLTTDEERDRGNVFDIELLGRRLVEVTRWLADRPDLGKVRFGYFGASTGAAAALWAASEPDVHISAVVSRGGRPDLAGARLQAVTAPTLLIVGGLDQTVLELNRQAQAELRCENRVDVIPGASHLFQEPGTLERVAELAVGWFEQHLGPARRRREGVGSTAEPGDEEVEAELAAREEAEGVELFADPDAFIPARALREGSPGHEALVADEVGLSPGDEEDERVDEDEWEER